jgi:hypothetical protein
MPETPNTEVQPTLDQFELASVVADRVSIEAILLSESRTKRSPDLGSHSQSVQFSSTIQGISFGIDREEKKIFVIPSFSIRSQVEERDDLGDILVIDATFVLIYGIESTEGIEERHVEAFGSTSGIYNAWPYWREFVQSTSVRMGMTPLVVPVFRLNP